MSIHENDRIRNPNINLEREMSHFDEFLFHRTNAVKKPGLQVKFQYVTAGCATVEIGIILTDLEVN